MLMDVIDAQEPKWLGFLKTGARHDFYHLPRYAMLAARQEGGEPIAFYAETDKGAFLAPLLLRKIPRDLGVPGGWYDATTAYGYPTPLMAPHTDAHSLSGFLDAFRQVAIDWGIVSVFFRLHPLLPLPKEALAVYGELVHHGQTVYIDLTQPLDAVRKGFRKGYRYDIRRLDRFGFKPVMDDWGLYTQFKEIYHDNMKRVAASRYYLFGDRYFDGLRTALGKDLHLCAVLSPNGDVACAGLFTTVNGIVQYHLSGTAGAYLRQAPSKLMLDHVCGWAKEHGNELFHLGGGVGSRADSLFRFKAGFSKLRADFYTYRMILDSDKYEYLVCSRVGLDKDTNVGDKDFFPAYRMGI